MIDLLFVYGTLQKQTKHKMSLFLKENATFIDAAYFYGKLYDVGQFPAAIKSKNIREKVYGSLFKITDCNFVLNTLDLYEDAPCLYTRELITVYTSNNNKKEAWVYIFNKPTSNLILISGGDYLNYLKS